MIFLSIPFRDSVRRRSWTAFVIALFLGGCTSYQHITPPPPRVGAETWKAQVMGTIPWAPGELPQLVPDLAAYVRFGDHTVGLGMKFANTILPAHLTYAYYHPLGDELYLQGTLHVNQLFQGLTIVPDPNLEATLGLVAQSGELNHGIHIGMGYLNEPADEGGFRWNPFSDAPRSTFVPALRYQALHGEVTFAVAYRPGISRAYNRMLATPATGSDTLLFIPADAILRLDTLESGAAGNSLPDVANGDYVFRLRDGRNVRISDHYAAPRLPVFSRPYAGLFRGRDMAHGSNYWHSKTIDYYWVITDSGNVRNADSLTVLDRRGLLLEPRPIVDHYVFTGDLLVVRDRTVLRTLEEAPIPFWHDVVISLGYRSEDPQNKE